MFKIKFIAFIILLAGVTACGIDDGDAECSYSENNEVTLVAGPDTAIVNQEITLNVSVKMLRTCGVFGAFNETNGYPKNIYAQINYPDCDCPVQNTSVTVPYTFSASTPGQYELRFQTATTPIVKTITVTE